MPAALETGFFGGNVPAWHGLGTVIEEDVVAASEAIKLAGLDWEVELVPLYSQFSGNTKLVDNEWGVQRSTDGKVLGIVSERYVPVQNHEAFTFVDDIVDSGEAKYHTAGSLKGGKNVWMLAKVGEDINIAGMESEKTEFYILLSNSHDGSKALTVAITPIRVVCQNTLNLALRSAPRMWKARHRVSSLEKFGEARQTLGLSFNYIEAFQKEAELLLNTKMSDTQFEEMLEEMFPLKTSETDSKRAVTMNTKVRNSISGLYFHAANLKSVRGTAWAAINAVGEYNDHFSTVKETKQTLAIENRMKKQLDPTLRDKAMTYVAKKVLVVA